MAPMPAPMRAATAASMPERYDAGTRVAHDRVTRVDAVQLFRYVIDDLDARIAEPRNEYELLRAAGLLRLLLTDSAPEPLMDTAARIRGVTPNFLVRIQGPSIRLLSHSEGTWSFMHYRLTPWPAAEPHGITRAEFVEMPVADSGAGLVPVKLAIYCGAVTFGGVHFNPRPSWGNARQLIDYLDTFRERSVEQVTSMLLDIARVTLRAAQPLL